jgi:hypothetical protein
VADPPAPHLVQKPTLPFASRLLWTACGGLMAVYLLALVIGTFVHIQLPSEIQYGESIVLEETRRVASGQPLYPPPIDFPLMVTAYPPLYYVLVGTLQQLADDPSFAVGRLVSAAAMFASAALLAWSVRSLVGRWWAGLLAAGFFLTQNLTVLLWASQHRVDPLALSLTVAGLALATARRLPAAAVFFVLAVLTKQAYLAAPVAVCVALWPDRRALIRFVGVFLVGLLLAGIGALALYGPWLAWHTIIANANPWGLEYFAAMIGQFLQFNALPLCLAAAAFGLPERPGERMWRAYFVLTGLVSLLTIGKFGASSNYWLELSAAIAVLIGIYAGRLAADPRLRGPFSSTVFAALTFAALLMGIPAYQATLSQALDMHQFGPRATSPGMVEIAPIVAAEQGDVLTDDPALALMAGKPIEIEFIIFTLLAAQHVWDEQPILDAIRDHRFALVVLTQPLEGPPKRLFEARWTPAVDEALRAAYQPAGEQGGYFFYRPAAQ